MIKNATVIKYYMAFLIFLISLGGGFSLPEVKGAEDRVAEDKRAEGGVNDHTFIPKIYTIYNISMDERASTSRRASMAALRKAEHIALEKLFRKIIRAEDHDKLPVLSEGQVTELVSGIEVANEKSSHVRYIADFTIHFSREKIYNFLSVLEIPFAETLSNEVSILPLLEKESAIILWEKNNDWRRAWQAYDTVNNLVPVRVIAPSLANRMAITAWQAQNGDIAVLQKFAEQKNLRHLYVMIARVKYDFNKGQNVIDLVIYGNDGNRHEYKNIIIDKTGEDDLPELYNEAIKQATYWLDNRWKEKVLIHYGASSQLNVVINFDQSEDWFKIKKQLESVSLIRNIIIKKLTTTMAVVEMEHSGDAAQIVLTLSQKNLILSQGDLALTDQGDHRAVQNEEPLPKNSLLTNPLATNSLSTNSLATNPLSTNSLATNFWVLTLKK